MRFIEIDGKRYDVPDCGSCLFYDGGDGDYYGESCTHPDGDGVCARWGGSCENGHRKSYGPKCPLREAPKFDPESLEWVRRPLSEEEKLGYMLAFFMPMLLENIAKMDPETKERIIKNLEEMLRMAQVKPEERPLCTMDQEEAIKRGIETCTVKEEKE